MSKLEGVKEVDVNFNKKIAVITMNPGVDLSKDAVAAALQKSNRYGLTDFKEKLPEVKRAPDVKKPEKQTAVLGISGMT